MGGGSTHPIADGAGALDARFAAVWRVESPQAKYRQLAIGGSVVPEPIELAQKSRLSDDLLGLIFMACHPVLSADAKSAMTLRLVCGLTTDEVSRALLVRQSTLAQRIVRARRALWAAQVRFELP
jgi:RNA polymerase sigma-70 factor, ECF subfamily